MKSSSFNVLDENRNKVQDSAMVLQSWSDDFISSKANANLAWHLVFSIDEAVNKENIEILLKSTLDSLDISLNGEYKFIAAIHSHQNKPHCHIIVNKTNIFSKKIYLKI